MGCFNYTCAVSGLPIRAGDAVRFLMLTQSPYDKHCGINTNWFVRALSLRARYNDYGSVEDVEDGPLRESWMRGLQIDLIERGVGENTVHDVATSKGMTFEELLEALWEQRVLVSRNVRERRPRFPSPTRVSSKSIAAYVRALERTSGRFTVSRARPLLVRQAMVREDVWQALLRMRHSEIPAFNVFRKRVALYCRQDETTFDPSSTKDYYLCGWVFEDAVTFMVGIGTHIRLAREAGVPIDALVDSIAEFAYVQIMLGRMEYAWRPGEPGGQDPNWRMHVRFHRELSRIARDCARVDDASDADLDTEDEDTDKPA